MTNKEAKEKLYIEWQKFLEDNIDYAGISEAYKTAFKALEQEPCENCISRQAVNELVDELARAISDERCFMPRGRDTASIMQDILDLPSVTPQSKKITIEDVKEYCESRCLTIITNELLYKLTHPKIKTCKDCKWWKDSDGAYRRGIETESQCPMNRKEVYEGNGYCFLFEPQKIEDSI